jgi:hypothetical protein
MDENKVVIELPRDVATGLLWLASGMVSVAAAFAWSYDPVDPWPALNSAGIVGLVYALALMIRAVRLPVSRTARLTILVCVLVAGAGGVFWWRAMESAVRSQQTMLGELRVITGRSILNGIGWEKAAVVWNAYRAQPEQAKRSVGAVYEKLYPEQGRGSRFPLTYSGSFALLFVAEHTDNCVVFVASDSVAHGKDPEFRGYHGLRGRIQERFVITSRGVDHVEEN